jgi:hypothetical protein
LLKKLANAQTYDKWPEWLHSKVRRLLAEGASVAQIRNRILWDDDTYVKLKTIKSRIPK